MDEMKVLSRMREAAERERVPAVDVAARVARTIARAGESRTQAVWIAAAALSMALAAAAALWALSWWSALQSPLRSIVEPVSVVLQ